MRGARWAGGVVLVLAALALGWFGRGLVAPPTAGPAAEPAAASGEGPCPGGAEPLYRKAPMDPTYVREEPGKSPMGMELVPVCPGEQGAGSGPGIRIESGVLQNIGVKTFVVEPRDLARKVRAVGRVDYDERLVEHVHTKIQGWIERLLVEYQGEMVERGQPLFEIYSPELVSTQEELLQAARYLEMTARSPVRDVAQGGEALFRATRRRLELWDIPDRDIQRLLETGTIRKSLTLYAPAEGVVVNLMAREGMEVTASQNLYTIADLSTVWVYADIYEYELPWVAVGQRAVAELSYLPGKEFEGEVTYVYPYLDPKTRTARVRLEVANPGIVLKPDMFANVTIEADVREDVLAVPQAAILRSGQRNLVIVALGDGRFLPREVETGIESGDGWVEIGSGLRADERIVTSGQFLIDSESRLREAVQKLLGSDTEPAADAGAGVREGEGAPEGGAHTMPGPSTQAGGAMSHEAGATESGAGGGESRPAPAQGEGP